MGNADQSPLRLDFLRASQIESSETHIVFHIPEGVFWLDRALFSQNDALFGE
jgi:hypothetical protein